MKHLSRILSTLCLFFLSSCVLFDTFQREYSATSTTFWVVDEETMAPIPGAIVTANWELVMGSLAGGPVVQGQMWIMETESDEKGKAFLPAWGPEPNRHGGHIRDADPQMFVYRAGYQPVRLDNFNRFMQSPKPGTPYGFSLDSLRHSLWDGETIKLSKATNKKYAYLNTSLDGVAAGLDFALGGGSCDWKLLPKMTIVLLDAHLVHRENLREDRCGALDDRAR